MRRLFLTAGLAFALAAPASAQTLAWTPPAWWQDVVAYAMAMNFTGGTCGPQLVDVQPSDGDRYPQDYYVTNCYGTNNNAWSVGCGGFQIVGDPTIYGHEHHVTGYEFECFVSFVSDGTVGCQRRERAGSEADRAIQNGEEPSTNGWRLFPSFEPAGSFEDCLQRAVAYGAPPGPPQPEVPSGLEPDNTPPGPEDEDDSDLPDSDDVRETVCDSTEPGQAGFGLAGLATESAKAEVGGVVFGAVGLACSATKPGSDGLSRAACLGFSGISTAAAGVGLGLAATGVGVVPGLIAGAVGAWAGAIGNIACFYDPPDANFRTIAKPRRPKATGLPPRARLPEAVFRRLRAVGLNAAAIASHGTAMGTCMNRASGARDAADIEWEARQRACAASYAASTRKLMVKHKRLLRTLARAMRAARVEDVRISAQRLRRARTRILKIASKELVKAGARAEEISFVTRKAKSELARLSPPRTLIKLIAGRKTMKALDQAAAGLRAIEAQYVK